MGGNSEQGGWLQERFYAKLSWAVGLNSMSKHWGKALRVLKSNPYAELFERKVW